MSTRCISNASGRRVMNETSRHPSALAPKPVRTTRVLVRNERTARTSAKVGPSHNAYPRTPRRGSSALRHDRSAQLDRAAEECREPIGGTCAGGRWLFGSERAPGSDAPFEFHSSSCEQPVAEIGREVGRRVRRACDIPRVYDQLTAAHLDELVATQNGERCLHGGAPTRQVCESRADLVKRGIERSQRILTELVLLVRWPALSLRPRERASVPRHDVIDHAPYRPSLTRTRQIQLVR
jgi:hypothetical protein